MKCPECHYVQKRSSGLGLRCGACGYTFCFDPKDPEQNPLRMTDVRFRAILDRTTDNGTRAITADELYTQACRFLQKRWIAFRVVVVLALASFVWLLAAPGPGPVIALLGLTVAGFASGRRKLLDRAEWEFAVRKWEKRTPIAGLIKRPSLSSPPPDWKEPDIYDYGFERLIICDDPLTVDWLVKNGVHAQERALIMTEDGYPSYLLDRAQSALAERSDLPVFLLHASSIHGVGLEARLRGSESLFVLGAHPVVDLGLSPKDVRRLKLPREHQRRPDRVKPHALPIGSMTTLLTLALSGNLTLAATSAQPGTDVGGSFG